MGDEDEEENVNCPVLCATEEGEEVRLESSISGAALMADSSCTSAERRKRVGAACYAIRQALQDLGDEYMASGGRKDENLGKAVDDIERKTRDLRRQLRKGAAEYVSDCFQETAQVPFLLLLEAAYAGNEHQVEGYATVFADHVNIPVGMANVACSMSSDEGGVKTVRCAAAHLEDLCPQVIDAARVLAAHPRSKTALKNLDALCDAWESHVRLLNEALDDITRIDDDLADSENPILEDLNECDEENDADALDSTAGAIRGRSACACSAAMFETDNYEPGIYTERVLDAEAVYRIVRATPQSHILEDLNECDEENDADALDSTAGAIRGRSACACSAAMFETDNYEPGIYTERVLDAEAVYRIVRATPQSHILEDLNECDEENDADALDSTAGAIRGRSACACSAAMFETDNYEPGIYTERVLDAEAVYRIVRATPQSHILEDLNECDEENDADALDSTAGAIRGRSACACSAAMFETDNYEPGIYTERVLDAEAVYRIVRATPQSHILEDLNECDEENDADALDSTAGAIRGRSACACSAAMFETDNYEPGIYTERVLDAEAVYRIVRATPQSHILEDLNECDEENDADALDSTAGAIRGRSACACSAAMFETDNYEPGIYTERVLDAEAVYRIVRATPQSHILEDLNECDEENDADALDSTAGAIRGRSACACSAAMFETDNYEPGIYTERVLDAEAVHRIVRATPQSHILEDLNECDEENDADALDSPAGAIRGRSAGACNAAMSETDNYEPGISTERVLDAEAVLPLVRATPESHILEDLNECDEENDADALDSPAGAIRGRSAGAFNAAMFERWITTSRGSTRNVCSKLWPC
ncbi:uncharacterized protein LOC135379204 [Ornithodoros turicata]|uniref:uncharacterized protein LOC135379204 n=1 Tax=Ornithodoros turicata TaxID=34597 RepID=UPI00313A0180